MNTQLIYVNKGSAEVKNDTDGSFINQVPSVIVKPGDLISVEGIAISTIGTGADVIEIPKVVKEYDYTTNKMMVEFMVYIHQNFRYTCVLPQKYNAGAGGTQTIYTSQGDLNYGDLDPSIYVRNNNTSYEPKNSFVTQTYGGTRLYIGTFGDDGDSVYEPMRSTTENDQNLGTGNKVFNLMTTNLQFEVPFGYNTPTNIASKVTFDLTSAMKTPNVNNAQQDPVNEVVINDNTNTAIPGAVTQQATVTSSTGSVITINGLPNQYFGKTANPANPYWYSTYSNFLCVKNPFYWYYGTRLHAQLPNGGQKRNEWYFDQTGIADVTQGDIINLLELRTNSIDTTVQTGDILATNLEFNTKNISNLANFIHSEKRYTMPINQKKTQEEMIKDKTDFFTLIPIGKYNDGNAAPADNNAKLTAKGQSIANTCSPTNVKIKSYYQGADYIQNTSLENLLPLPDIGVVGNLYPFNIDGQNLNSFQICEKYDINIKAIETIDSGGSVYYTIGIIMEATLIPNNVVSFGQFCVFDPTFTRDQAHASMLLSPDVIINGNVHTLNDMIKGINVGAPNINLFFNGDRSKFSFKNTYWSNFIGNEWGSTDENPNADQEVFTSNKDIISGYNFYAPSLNPIIFDQYAQSGLGFYKLYVEDKNKIFQPINEQDPDDINSKFNGSLLQRIGFDYQDLINTWGLSNVFFQERFLRGNLPSKHPQYFPYPMTCNPRIDTSFNISINNTDNNYPAFNLSLQRNVRDINIACSSAEILASNKPEKLATPYWLIESDILPAIKYYVESNPRNIMAVVNRAYGSGDFVFSFATDYKFIATKGFVITQIKTNVLTSDLIPADIQNNTVIIYKVESPVLPNFISQTELDQIEEEESEKK
jgi:hypothetical protein